MTNRFGSEHDSEIIRRYQAGETGKEIARSYGTSDATVYAVLRRNGVPARPGGSRPGWTDSEENRRDLVAAYTAGESVRALARRLGCRNQTVIQVLDDAGLEWRHPGAKRRFTDEQGREMAAAYVAGETLQQIAERYGTNAQTVRGYLLRAGVEMRRLGAPAFWTVERKAEAARRYEAGEQIQDIAAGLGCGVHTLRSTLREAGVLKPYRETVRRGADHHSWRGGRITDRNGYVRVKVPDEDRHLADRTRTGYVMEHRLVMARSLGRALLPDENVHHKNGVKGDNRPENLELWVKMQPTGQRVEELVDWATEVLRRYAPNRLTDASQW